jgi:hypothetical protein
VKSLNEGLATVAELPALCPVDAEHHNFPLLAHNSSRRLLTTLSLATAPAAKSYKPRSKSNDARLHVVKNKKKKKSKMKLWWPPSQQRACEY